MRLRKPFCAMLLASIGVVACGWNPSRPFDREAPAVSTAIRELDAGNVDAATRALEDYLSTGACSEGNIGTPDLVKKRPDGAFDLGLSLFRIGEAFGRRFGEEVDQGGEKADPAIRTARTNQVDCALRIVRAVAELAPVPGPYATESERAGAPIELRARARYLEGNLLFLNEQYEDAVKAYDKALTLCPGQVDAGDAVGRDAAWNRAIALRRIEDQKDAGPDAAQDASQDAAQDGAGDGASPDGGSPDGGGDSGADGGDSGSKEPDGGADGGGPDGGQDSATPPRDPPDAGPPPPPSKANQDERMLDQLENAPTVQQELAKKAAQRRRGRGMADK